MREDLGVFKRCWKIWVKEEVERTFIIERGDHSTHKSGDGVQIPAPSPLAGSVTLGKFITSLPSIFL